MKILNQILFRSNHEHDMIASLFARSMSRKVNRLPDIVITQDLVAIYPSDGVTQYQIDPHNLYINSPIMKKKIGELVDEVIIPFNFVNNKANLTINKQLGSCVITIFGSGPSEITGPSSY